jgi:hypothetical protein
MVAHVTVLLATERRWSCPNCTATSVTREATPHTRMHACAGLAGITAPMVEDGIDCKVEAVECEDYMGRDQLFQFDGRGRAISAVVTTREDGNDSAVLAPCAIGRLT